jgi:hypothetical protein
VAFSLGKTPMKVAARTTPTGPTGKMP